MYVKEKGFFCMNVCMMYVDLCISMLCILYVLCYREIFHLFIIIFKVFVTLFDGRGRRKRKQVIQISLINVETLMV